MVKVLYNPTSKTVVGHIMRVHLEFIIIHEIEWIEFIKFKIQAGWRKIFVSRSRPFFRRCASEELAMYIIRLLLKIMCTRPRRNVSFLTSLWPRHKHITILYNIGLHYCANTQRKRSQGDVLLSPRWARVYCRRYHLTLQLQLTHAQLPQLRCTEENPRKSLPRHKDRFS